MALPLTLIPEMEEKSVLFKSMPKDIQNILLTEPVTANHHTYVFTLLLIIKINIPWLLYYYTMCPTKIYALQYLLR